MRTDCPSTPTALCPTARRYPGYEDGLPFNANGVVPYSPGLRGSPRYPGCAWEECNNHNVVVPKERTCGLSHTRRVAILKTHDGIVHSARSGHPGAGLHGCCLGTTPLGLFVCWAFTRGSAPAAQPRALWQNPVGIPGGGILQSFPHLRHLRITPPHSHSSASSGDNPSPAPKTGTPSAATKIQNPGVRA